MKPVEFASGSRSKGYEKTRPTGKHTRVCKTACFGWFLQTPRCRVFTSGARFRVRFGELIDFRRNLSERVNTRLVHAEAYQRHGLTLADFSPALWLPDADTGTLLFSVFVIPLHPITLGRLGHRPEFVVVGHYWNKKCSTTTHYGGV